MPECHSPRLGRFSPPPRQVAAVGFVLAIAAVLAGNCPALPPAARLALAHDAGSLALPRARAATAERQADRAVRAMIATERFLRAEREKAGITAEGEAAGDPSGLLGGEATPLMTTLGSLEAKRLSANPAWARAITTRFADRGIGAGDVVAASFSGSFPGLNLAVMAACDALGVRLVAISSVTASTWGANQPGFTWPEMEARLAAAALVRRATAAVTAGGDADLALDLDEEGRQLAASIRDRVARQLGATALVPADFADAVRLRLAIYRKAANGRPVALYVNVGGADASLGRSSAVLRRRSGFLAPAPFGRPSEQGVLARLAGEGVPALMLLNVRDLALRWGIPLDGR